MRRWLPLLSLLVACASYRESYLSELEEQREDAAVEIDAQVAAEPDAQPPDAAESVDSSEPDAAVVPDAALVDAVVASHDASSDAGEKSCCQLWADWRDGGLLSELGPDPCIELLCKPPPMLPTLP